MSEAKRAVLPPSPCPQQGSCTYPDCRHFSDLLRVVGLTKEPTMNDQPDRYDSSPQWPWVVAIVLIFAYGLWTGV